ncbi:hypothetical protein B5M09_013716, partial [Aphanomyces astaci]
ISLKYLPAAADIFGLDHDRKTRFHARVPEVSGVDQRSACNGLRPFVMPVSACMVPFSKRRITLFGFNRDHNSITNDEWVAWFNSAFEEDPQDLDDLKQRLQRAIRFDTKILDAVSLRSYAGRADALVGTRPSGVGLHQEGKMVVEVLTKSIKPEWLKTAVQNQLQLQRDKALKSDVFRYVNWLRTFAASHQRVPHLAYPYGSDANSTVGTTSRCCDYAQGQVQLRDAGHDLWTACVTPSKAWVNDASTATELTVSRPVMELLGFSVEDLLVRAKKKEEWYVSFVPPNELSGMANVKRRMAEKLSPTELDPDDGMECATRWFIPKPPSRSNRSGAS